LRTSFGGTKNMRYDAIEQTNQTASKFTHTDHLLAESQSQPRQFALRAEAQRTGLADATYQKRGILPAGFAPGPTSRSNSFVVHEQPASQALKPPLNVQITNVPEVSRGLTVGEFLQYVDIATTVGADEVRQIEKHFEQPNAINKDLMAIGKGLLQLPEYAFKPAKAIKSFETAAKSAFSQAEILGDRLSKPMLPEARAEFVGSLLPLFILEGEPTSEPLSKPAEINTMAPQTMDSLLRIDEQSLAGARGDWPTINRRPSPDVVKQIHVNACVSACGEMLTNGTVKQEHLASELAKYWPKGMYENPTADIEWLVQELGSDWKIMLSDSRDASKDLEILSEKRQPWLAELRDVGKASHAVIVDGLNAQGELIVRDPASAERYEMRKGDFLKFWNGRSIYHI
jgi:hypothetical protein